MDEQARVALVQARTVMLLVELEEMKAANYERDRQGYAQAYDDSAFADLAKRYEDLEYNHVVAFLRGEK